MLLAQHGYLGMPSRNYFIVGIAGDSNAAGRASTAGITTLPGKCFEFNGTTLVQLTTADISTAINGSYAKQFAFDHHARTGDIVVIVAGGVSSSTFAVGANTNNWAASPSGVNYDNFTNKMDACLAFLGKPQPDLIIWSLGVNDVTSAATAATIDTAMDNLMDRIETKYPSTLNLWTQIGRNTVAFNSQKFYDCRKNLINQIEAHPLQAMCNSALVFIFTTGYEADAIHYNAASDAWYGASCDRYLALSSVSNKWARGAIASYYTPVSIDVRNALDDLITTMYANADYFNSEGLIFYTADHVYSSQVDLCFRAAGEPVITTFMPGVCQRLNGTTSYLATSLNPAFFTNASSDDVIHMIKILDNRSGPLVSGALMGGGDPGVRLVLLQQSGSSAIIYRVNDNTVSSTALIGAFGDNQFYSMTRNGGTKAFYEGTSLLTSAAVGVVGVPSFNMPDGALNGGSNFMDIDLQARYSGKFTTLDLTALQTKIQAVIDAY